MPLLRTPLCRLVLAAGLAGCLLMPAVPASAGKNPRAKLVLHLVPYSNRNTCATGRLTNPGAPRTSGDLFPAKYTAYVLIVDGTPGAGIAAVQFGIAYNDTLKRGVDIIDWQECSLFNWPMPGFPSESITGNLLAWNQDTDCDTTGIRVAGYFYLTAYSRDRLMIIPRPADRMAAVATCGITPGSKNADALDIIPAADMGFADFGGGPGYNPWDPRQNLKGLKTPGQVRIRDNPPDSKPPVKR
jgi:hypothetical protein